MRLALLAGHDPRHIAASRQIALGACADVVLSAGTERSASFVERAEAIREARPDVVLLVADDRGADHAVELAEALRLATVAQQPRPAVLVSTDERTHARVELSLGHAVEAFGDVRSADVRAAVVARLRAMARGASDARLRDEGIEQAARTLAASSSRSIAILDVTGTSTSLVVARADGTLIAAHVPLGVGEHADRVVARAGLDRVRRWIPRAIDAPALLERVFNRAHWPDVPATNSLALEIELALARECVSRVLAEATRAELPLAHAARHADTIACTGRLATWKPSQTALVALDALAPESASVIARETQDAPLAAGGTALEPLTLVAPVSVRRSATVHVTDATGTVDERVGRGAFVLLRTTGAVQLAGDGATRASSDPLSMGVIVDARGRPLELPPRDAERLPTIQRWYGALDALPSGDDA
ncbi:MAG TPA: hypothetical protein VI814_04235 [Candidatus Limnocylindria bacterium]